MNKKLKKKLKPAEVRSLTNVEDPNIEGGELREDGSVLINFSQPVRRDATFEIELPEEVSGDMRASNLEDLPDELEMSFSSEAPVSRWGVDEILSHDGTDANFARFKNVGAVLKNHDPNVIVGTPVKVWLDKETRKGRVRFRFGTTPEAAKAKREALIDKSLRGTSVGYLVKQYVFLKDEDVNYKGRITGPAYVATKWEALEASLTPIAADPSVGVGRSAGSGAGHKPEEGSKMEPKFRAWLVAKGHNPDELEQDTLARLQSEYDQETRSAGTGAATPPAPAAASGGSTTPAVSAPDMDQVREAARREELARVGGIMRLCQTHKLDDAKRDAMINENLTMAQAQERVLSILATETRSFAGQVEVVTDGRTSFRSAAVEALQIRRGGLSRRDAKNGGEVVAVMSLRELARECLTRANMPVPSDLASMITRALAGPVIMQDDIDRFERGGEMITGTTSDFPYILATTANKSMLEGYGSMMTSWEKWCKVGSLSDFKAAQRIKLSEAGDLQKVLEGGHYPQTSFSEDQNPIQVYTYGQKFNLSRQAIVNDDLSAFTTIPARLGRSAKRLPNILAVIELAANRTMTDGNALFSSGHNNLNAETDYALDTLAHGMDGIQNMKKMIGTQRGMLHAKASAESETLYMGLELAVLLVATDAQEFIAKQIISSPANPSQSNSSVINPLQGVAEVVTERLLGDSGISGYSETAYFGFANPADAPVIEVAFLNGVQEPFMEEVDQTDADGRVFKVRLDCGAAEIDYAGAARETGVDA